MPRHIQFFGDRDVKVTENFDEDNQLNSITFKMDNPHYLTVNSQNPRLNTRIKLSLEQVQQQNVLIVTIDMSPGIRELFNEIDTQFRSEIAKHPGLHCRQKVQIIDQYERCMIKHDLLEPAIKGRDIGSVLAYRSGSVY